MGTSQALAIGAFANIASEQAAEQTSELILASEIKRQQLNPARGDKNPKTASLWCNRKGSAATGFLVTFVDGFSSSPHIHDK